MRVHALREALLFHDGLMGYKTVETFNNVRSDAPNQTGLYRLLSNDDFEPAIIPGPTTSCL